MIGLVEMQGTIQRTQDISQYKQNEDIKPQFEHVTISTSQQQKDIKKHEQVVKQDNADKEKDKYDAKEKGNGQYLSQNKKGNNQRKTGENNQSKNKLGGSSSSFDMFA